MASEMQLWITPNLMALLWTCLLLNLYAEIIEFHEEKQEQF